MAYNRFPRYLLGFKTLVFTVFHQDNPGYVTAEQNNGSIRNLSVEQLKMQVK